MAPTAYQSFIWRGAVEGAGDRAAHRSTANIIGLAMADLSKLTVIVIPLLGGRALEACLRSLAPGRAECIVVLPATDDRPPPSGASYTAIRCIRTERSSVPLRRQIGVEAANGDIVALIEDTSVAAPGWCEAVCGAFDDPNVAGAGGPVDISRGLPGRFQALGCSEYGRFHPRRFPRLVTARSKSGGLKPARRLPGNNLAYRRTPLLDLLRRSDQGLFEIDVNEGLRAQGLDLVLQPAMSVSYAAIDLHGAKLSTRFQHGRLYAGRRSAGGTWHARAAAIAKSLLLPPVLSGRALHNALYAIRPADLPKVAPWILAMASAWAFGEAVGCLAGEGRGRESWR